MTSKTYTLTVTHEGAQYLLACLAEQPYKTVAQLIGELQGQLLAQDTPATIEPASEAATDDAAGQEGADRPVAAAAL